MIRRAGHELGDAARAGGADREWVEVGLHVELSGQQGRGDVPAAGGADYLSRKPAGTKDGIAVRRRRAAGSPQTSGVERGLSV